MSRWDISYLLIFFATQVVCLR